MPKHQEARSTESSTLSLHTQGSLFRRILGSVVQLWLRFTEGRGSPLARSDHGSLRKTMRLDQGSLKFSILNRLIEVPSLDPGVCAYLSLRGSGGSARRRMIVINL